MIARRIAVYLMRPPEHGKERQSWPVPGRGDTRWTRLNPWMAQIALPLPPEGTWVVDGGLEWTYRIGHREALETAHQLAATSWSTTVAEQERAREQAP